MSGPRAAQAIWPYPHRNIAEMDRLMYGEARTIFDKLDALSRQRSLTYLETVQLDRAMKKLGML